MNLFESGLSYVRVDFHLHTHKDKEFKYSGEQNAFVKNYVSALKQAGINIGVITNHNKFDKDEYDAIRRAANKESIFILPGVELTVKEGANGIHTLIVFNPAEWLLNGTNHIQTFLTSAFATIPNPENGNKKCAFDLKDTLNKLDDYDRDYFIIFAHVNQGCGLFEECKGGLLDALSGLPSFKKRVLGLQKATTHDKIAMFHNCFKYRPALVEGSDPKSISDVGKGSKQTYLKVGEYSYSAVKFALQDNVNRVSNVVPEIKHGFIEAVEFQGGKFDGKKIFFSSGLNTLIGIRGSGKSAVLETVRYALGLSAQEDNTYKISLVKNILGAGGKVILSVIDKYHKHYLISRIWGEKICVLDEDGNDLNVEPSIVLGGVSYFGQKDLSNSAEHENNLIEKLLGKKVVGDTSITRCVEKLSVAVGSLLNAGGIPSKIEEIKMNLAEIEYKMSIYIERGIAEKVKKQVAYNKDQATLISVKDKINRIGQSFKEVIESQKTVSAELENYVSEYNNELIVAGKKILSAVGEQLSIIDNSVQRIQIQESEFSKLLQNLSEHIDALSDEFAKIKREIKDEDLDADTYVRLTENRDKTKASLNRLEEEVKSKSAIEGCFNEAVEQRNITLGKTFQIYKSEIEYINKSQDNLRIEITFKGARDEFKASMKNNFRGSGLSDIKYQNICNVFDDYVAVIEDWLIFNGKKLKQILTESEYVKLSDRLHEQYGELLKYQVPNKVDIYYHGKRLKEHSIGQRASALILFVLTQGDNDIILIDQPEDDLDNKVIYDEVIKAIATMKNDTQFIFATHNANIPVLGDAERVLVMEYKGATIDVAQGNIDLRDTHKQIVDIMEGGKAAFEKRHLIYEAWR